MRQRFKARELWLFAPFLLILAGALYWARVEKVSASGAHGMFVSDFQLTDAPGYWREKGYSHQVEVKVSHPWPRPKWWGQQFGMQLSLFPLHPEQTQPTMGSYKRNQFVEAGAVLTVKQNGKIAPWPKSQPHLGYSVRFDGNDYVFEHRIKASEIPANLGAVTFRGLYRIADNGLLPVAHEICGAGEILPMKRDKDAGAQLLTIDAAPLYESIGSAPGGKTKKTENFWAQFIALDTSGAPKTDKYQGLVVYDFQLFDEKGRVPRPSYKGEFSNGVTGGYIGWKKDDLPADQKRTAISIEWSPTMQTTGRIKMRGKISWDEHWPIPFEITLPPRDNMKTSVDDKNAFSIPLWRNGKPVETPPRPAATAPAK